MGLNGSPSILDLYVDVVAANTAAYPSVGRREIPLLEQRSKAYPGTAMLMRSGDIQQRIRGGTRIESQILLDQSGDFGLMDAGSDWTWNRSEGHHYLTSHWRKYKATDSIDEDEIMLSMGAVSFDSTAVALSILNIEKMKKAKMWTKAAEVRENFLWGNPNVTAGPTMELATAGALPRSLLSAVNEFDATHSGAGKQGLAGTHWTTQHGKVPGDYMSLDGTRSLLAAQKFSYATSMEMAAGGRHLFDAMDEALDGANFEGVPLAETFNEESNLQGAPGIFTERRGKTQWNRTVRNFGNFFGMAGPTDPVQRSVYDGLNIIRVPALDGAALYPLYDGSGNPSSTGAGAAVASTAAGTNSGGRFFIFNPKYIKQYMRESKAFQFKDWYALDQTNPERYVCWLRLDDALHFESFQRNAVVYPSIDQTNY